MYDVSRGLKFSVKWVPFCTGIAYVLIGLVLSLDISAVKAVPLLSWAHPNEQSGGSSIILVARESGIPHLDIAVATILVFTALTAANTNLYVASRTLFSLTRKFARDDRVWYKRALSWVSQTNKRGVPMRALTISSFFSWIPFISMPAKSSQTNTDATTVGIIL
jgi:amino acid transporter